MKKKVKALQAPVKYVELTDQKGKKTLFELSTIIRVADMTKYRVIVVREIRRIKGSVDVIYRVIESMDEINTLLGREAKNNE